MKPVVEARGRNGWFYPTSVYIASVADEKDDVDVLQIEISSRRPGNSSPIILTGPRDAITDLFDRLYQALQQVVNDEGQWIRLAVPSGIPKKISTAQVNDRIRKLRLAKCRK
jgi:hypothetical protein